MLIRHKADRHMNVRQTLDVSSFMLFEATGDSEDDCDALSDEQFGYDIGKAHDDDDAQSCNYDGSEDQNCKVGEQLSGYESCASDADCDDRDGIKKEGEEAGVFGLSYCDDDDEIQKQQKSSFSVDDSGQQLMDEMEKNRRFWEACLAS